MLGFASLALRKHRQMLDAPKFGTRSTFEERKLILHCLMRLLVELEPSINNDDLGHHKTI